MKYSTLWSSMIWIGVWQIIYIIIGNELLFPSPLGAVGALGDLVVAPSFYYDIGMTLYRVIMSMILSLGLGILTAVSAYLIKGIEVFLKPLITVLKVTPVMAVIILALLWFKSGNIPIFVSILMCYPIVYSNTLMGLKCIDKDLIEMAKVFKVGFKQILLKIYIPHLLPSLEVALKLVAGLAWKVIIAAEVLAVPKYSMGYNLLNAKVYMESDQLFAWIIIIIILSTLCERLIDILINSRKVKPS